MNQISETLAQDYIGSWKLISSELFRIVRDNGRIFGIIPTSKISVNEIRLFSNPKVSTYTISIELLEENNLEMFMLAAIGAKEKQIRLEAGMEWHGN